MFTHLCFASRFNLFTRRRLGLVGTLLLGLGSSAAGLAQTPEELTKGEAITLNLIMSDPDWLGRQPENPFWDDMGEHFYFSRKRPGVSIRDRFRANPNRPNESVRVTPDRAAKESVAGGVWRYDPETQRYTEKVYIRNGDVFHRDLKNEEIRQLTRTTTAESQPLFLNDGSIGFRRGNQFLVRDLRTGLESEPFPLVFAKEPEKKKLEEAKKKSLLAREQDRLFDILKKNEAEKELREAERRVADREDPSRPGTPFYLGDDVELGSAVLSPSGRHLALVLLPKKRPKPAKTKMPSWVTTSGDIETREVRHKVGTVKPFESKLMLLDRETRKAVEIKTDGLPGISTDPLSDLREAAKKREEERKKALEEAAKPSNDDKAEAEPDAASKKDEKEDAEAEKAELKPRAVQFLSLSFNHDGSGLVFQAYSFDNKDRWLASVDLESGACVPRHHLNDPAWINWRHNSYGWSRDGRKVWLLSEESGYSHLYLVDVAAKEASEPVVLTQGDFVVSEPQLSVDGRYLYFRANVAHPGRYDVYRTGLTDGRMEQITDLGGMASAVLSPDGRQLLITHSTATRPSELYVQSAEPGAMAVRQTETVSDAFKRRSWTAPQYVEVPSSHGESSIHSRLYLPEVRGGGKRPAVMFVHGAGYLQNAHHGWSGYFREFLFHSFLVERGFVVLDMDYRASAGYGRDWRTAIYRHMGSVELEDLKDGVDWLVAHHGVDRERVGVYGGSYGGFLTMMALFNEPDLFAAGAALRPVTDWAHYNHGYTSRILNTPELDPEAFLKSSPIEFASGLEKPLLICAPMLDDNVFFQDSVRLVQRLIELEKEDWWIALYPVEPHGFREPSSWLDEYRRIWDLFERFL